MGKVPLFSRQKPSKDQFVFRILFVSFSSFFFWICSYFLPHLFQKIPGTFPFSIQISSVFVLCDAFLLFFFRISFRRVVGRATDDPGSIPRAVLTTVPLGTLRFQNPGWVFLKINPWFGTAMLAV